MAVRMQTAGQDDDECFGLGVNPEAGAGKAGMADARMTEQRPPWRAITGLYVPPQAPALARRRCRGVEHRPHGQRREDPAAIGSNAPVQDHLGEDSQIVGRCEQSGMPCDTSQRTRPRIVNDSAQHRPIGRLAFGRCDPLDWHKGRSGRAQRAEMCIDHAQRLKDPFPCERAQVASTLVFDKLSQDQKTNVGVTEPLTRRRHQPKLGNTLPGGFWAVLVVCEWIIRNKARTVAEELLDRDRGFAVVIKLGK